MGIKLCSEANFVRINIYLREKNSSVNIRFKIFLRETSPRSVKLQQADFDFN